MTTQDKLAEALRQILDATGGYVPNTSKVIWRNAQDALRAHAAEAAQTMTPSELADRIARGEKWKLAAAAPQQAAQDAKLPSDEDFRLHLGELTPDEVCVAKAAYRLALAAHSAKAQPPAASVTEVAELTWEPPDVTINVEQVGRFRSGDEHIVRVTFRSSDDGRRMTCFYAANESAAGYLHAMLAAQENPNG